MTMEVQPYLLLVDAYSQIYRAYYAVRSLTTKAGVPTNAVFAVTKLLLSLERDYPVRRGAFVFDKGKPAARIALAPLYKANRPPMPEDLRSQIPLIREMIGAFGWKIVEREGIEADDLIGSAADAFPQEEVRIVSSDKDLSQLIDERVKMLVPDHDGKGFSLRDAEVTLEKFGVPPSGIIDYLALIGDSSDNIPGVEGVGPKTAVSLMQEFGSIDAMFAAPEKIARESLRTKILASKERLTLNRRLIALDRTQKMEEFSFEKQSADTAKVRILAEQLELKSILRELEKTAPVTPSAEKKSAEQMEFSF